MSNATTTPVVTTIIFGVLALSSAPAQIINGSFEAGLAGWLAPAGTVSVETTPDLLFPAHGAKYLRISAAGTGNASVGHGPHVAGTQGVAQIYQNFVRPAGDQFCLKLSWDFLQRENPNSPNYNDFLSIDVLDVNHLLVANVVYCDTGLGGGWPAYTNVPGTNWKPSGPLSSSTTPHDLSWIPGQSSVMTDNHMNPAPAGYKVAWVDLSGLTSVGGIYRIAISVGNVDDSSFSSVAYIDEVQALVAQRNSFGASMRVLGSSHLDGQASGDDQGGDYTEAAPYSFTTSPGQKVAVRARGHAQGSPWGIIAGTFSRYGFPISTTGILNLDPNYPLAWVMNGFSPSSPFESMVGTLGTGSMFISGQIGSSVPPGTSFALQALMGDPASQSGLKLSALTEIRVGAPKIPMASTLVSGGANGSNGSTSVPFAAFPAFSFYGASYNTVHVGSNGYVTFGSGDTNGNESECQMEDDPRARIAACWDSLDPTSAASGGGVFMDQTAKTVTVTWRDVPEAGITANAGNNMTIQLYNNGAITIYFGSTSMSDGLTGISPGFGIASDGNRNLSRSFNSVGSFIGIPSTASAFQRFETQALPGSLCSVLQAADTCDLFTLGDSGPSRITFYPNGSGGYRLFTGTR